MRLLWGSKHYFCRDCSQSYLVIWGFLLRLFKKMVHPTKAYLVS
jgi:hypothetical protein